MRIVAARDIYPPDQWESLAAKTAGMFPNPEKVEQACATLGLKVPVRFLPFPAHRNTRGGYAGISRDPFTGGNSHLIYIGEGHAGPKNMAVWHELIHAMQAEWGDEFAPTDQLSDEEYHALPKEIEANRLAMKYADLDLFSSNPGDHTEEDPSAPVISGRAERPITAAPNHRTVRKFVFNADTGELNVGEQGPEEGTLPSHSQLAEQIGLDLVTSTYHLGTINEHGYVQFEGGGGKTTGRSRRDCELALQKALPNDVKDFSGGESTYIDRLDAGNWNFGSLSQVEQAAQA